MTERTGKHPPSYFPVFVDLRERLAVVVGGGEVALRKVEGLLAAGARVKVIAPELCRTLEELVAQGRLLLERRDYRLGDLDSAILAVAATSDPEVNRAVADEASGRNLLLNVVDVPDLCSFIVPSVIRRDELTVAISTGGMSPALAKRMRQKLEETLVPEYGPFLRLLGTIRSRVRQELPLPAQRESFWAEVVNSNAFDLFRSRGEEAAIGRIEEILQRVRDGELCTILAVGLNHKVAPVEVRERFALSGERVAEVLDRLGEVAGERVILSTCNRMEVYAVPLRQKGAAAELRRFLHSLQCSHLAESEVVPYLYALHNEDAASHLFGVASGIDSMILGEPQILGQVRDAYETAADRGAAGSVLSVLFQRALAAGKRARTETNISRNAVSVSHAAVELARQIFGEIASRTVLVVGAGEMSELAAKNLVDNGVETVLVVNRTWERAARLADQFGGTAVKWEAMGDALLRSDIVITSTGSPQPLFGPDLVGPVLRDRGGRPLFFIDIAVPRDVDPAVRSVKNVYLYDIDDLQSVVDANLREREKELSKVRDIVDEETESFVAWLRCQEVVPTIMALRDRLEQIRRGELARYGGKLSLSERDRNTLEALTQGIVNKLLHTPTVRLKAQANDGGCGLYLDAVKQLFDLE
ncbi:MAG: glutamyl-tRNA reductase [Chloroflexota bacterium]